MAVLAHFRITNHPALSFFSLSRWLFFLTDVADDFLQVDINEDPNGETGEANMEGMGASVGEIKDLSDLVFTKHSGKNFININCWNFLFSG